VRIKDTRLMVSTNSTGYFRIKVPANSTLLFSFVGYETWETRITKSDKITVALKPANNGLDEVVVVGYGTQKRTAITGAISTVYNAIEGRAPGVRVNGKSFQPQIDIRG